MRILRTAGGGEATSRRLAKVLQEWTEAEHEALWNTTELNSGLNTGDLVATMPLMISKHMRWCHSGKAASSKRR